MSGGVQMNQKSISSTEFQNKAGQYLDESGKAPIFITRYDRPVRVLLDIEEYERLKRYDTRQTLYPHELSNALKVELEKGFQGEDTPALDHLLK
jgi:prevent-host-death family protein